MHCRNSNEQNKIPAFTEVIFKKGKEDSKQRKPIIYRVAINVISVTKEGYLVAILWPRVLIKPNDKSS